MIDFKAAAFAGMACVASFPTSAGGWQDARWGMTVDQVAAIYAGRVFDPSSLSQTVSCNGTGHPALSMDHPVGEMRMTATFCFDKFGRLYEVKLEKSGNGGAADLFKGLSVRYGRPSTAVAADGRTTVTWNSEETDVTYVAQDDMLQIDYRLR